MRHVLVGALVGVLATIVAADRPSAEESCARDDVIRVATGDDVSVGGSRRELIGEWTADPNNPRIELVEVSQVADLKRGEMLAAAQAASCAAYDVLILDVAWTAEFAAAGLLREIDSVPDGLVPEAQETGRWRGTQYAIPFATDVGLLYRRKDLPQPTSWNELWDLARSQWREDQAGLTTQLDDYEGGTVALQEMLTSAGAEVIDADGEIVLGDSPHRERAAQALTRMRWAWADTLLDSSLNAKEAEGLADFAAGRSAYLRHWPYAYLRLTTDGRTPFAVSALPWPAALGGSNLAIPARSAKYDKALEFIRFMVDERNQRRLFACGGYAPVVTRAYKNVTTCDPPDSAASSSSDDGPWSTALQLQQLADVIRQALPSASRPKTEHHAQFSQVFRACVMRAVRDQRPADESVGMIAEALENARDGVLNGAEPCR